MCPGVEIEINSFSFVVIFKLSDNIWVVPSIEKFGEKTLTRGNSFKISFTPPT